MPPTFNNKDGSVTFKCFSEVSTAITCSISPPENYACNRSNGGAISYLIKKGL